MDRQTNLPVLKIDRQTILQAEHDVISDTYDYLNDKDADARSAIQYVLGAHDMALVLLNRLEGTKGEK